MSKSIIPCPLTSKLGTGGPRMIIPVPVTRIDVTVDTITDEQISKLIDFAGYHEWGATVSVAYVALHGVIVRQTKRKIERRKSGAVYQDCRRKCAAIYNEHAEQIEQKED